MVLDLRPDESLLEAGFAREVSPNPTVNSMLVSGHIILHSRSSELELELKHGYSELLLLKLIQVVNRVQKLRKKAGLEPTDFVEVYYKVLENSVDSSDSSVLRHVFESQVQLPEEIICWLSAW